LAVNGGSAIYKKRPSRIVNDFGDLALALARKQSRKGPSVAEEALP